MDYFGSGFVGWDGSTYPVWKPKGDSVEYRRPWFCTGCIKELRRGDPNIFSVYKFEGYFNQRIGN